MRLYLNIVTTQLNCILLGMMISSISVRLDHPEIGYIQYPIIIGSLTVVNLAVQLTMLAKRLTDMVT